MDHIFGTGDFRYEAVPDWGRLPEGWSLSEVAAVAVDSQDRVYVFNRGEHPMLRLRPRRQFPDSPGARACSAARMALHIGPDDSLWCTDDGDHTVRKCTLDGSVLLTIGLPDRPAPFMCGQPFNRCTHTALSPEGDIYVSDGYGNAARAQVLARGQAPVLLGRAGDGAGRVQPAAQHRLRRRRLVYVADRENHRIQIFDGNGQYQAQWTNLHRPCSLFLGKGNARSAMSASSGRNCR